MRQGFISKIFYWGTSVVHLHASKNTPHLKEMVHPETTRSSGNYQLFRPVYHLKVPFCVLKKKNGFGKKVVTYKINQMYN